MEIVAILLAILVVPSLVYAWFSYEQQKKLANELDLHKQAVVVYVQQIETVKQVATAYVEKYEMLKRGLQDTAFTNYGDPNYEAWARQLAKTVLGFATKDEA